MLLKKGVPGGWGVVCAGVGLDGKREASAEKGIGWKGESGHGLSDDL